MTSELVRSAIRRFIADESAQDVVEYALLTALVGVAAIVTWQVVADRVGIAYGETDSAVQGLAEPPDPIPPE